MLQQMKYVFELSVMSNKIVKKVVDFFFMIHLHDRFW